MSGRRRVAGDVTFNQLRTFKSVAQAGSFAKAAELLDISQPTVSELIRAFEDRLGRPLFRRRNGSAACLTPSGVEVLENVTEILEIYSRILKENPAERRKSIVKVSVGTHLIEKFIRPILPKIYRAFPAVEIEFFPLIPWTQIAHSIDTGALDIAVFAAPHDVQAPPDALPICDVEMVMIGAVGTRARLAAGLCSLQDLQYIFPIRRALGERFAAHMLAALGIRARVPPLFVEFVDVLLDMVERGDGVGAIQAYIAVDRAAEGRLEVLDIPAPPMRRMIVRSRKSVPDVESIEQMLREVLTTGRAEISPKPVRPSVKRAGEASLLPGS